MFAIFCTHNNYVNQLTTYGTVLDDSLLGLVYSKEFILVTFKHIFMFFCVAT